MAIILSPVLGSLSARSIPLNVEKNLKLYRGNNTFNVKIIMIELYMTFMINVF